MSRPPLRVAVVSPHQLVRVGVTGMLRGVPERVTVVDVSEHDGTLVGHDVVVLDLSGTTAGTDGLTDRRGSATSKPVVALVADPAAEDGRRVRAWRGVAALVPFSVRASELVDVLEAVAAGRVVDLSGRRDTHREALRGRHGLSERELDVLELMAEGLTNQEIVAELYLSPNTVKTYVRTAYRKIGARTRAQAVLWCVRHGMSASAGAVRREVRPEDAR